MASVLAVVAGAPVQAANTAGEHLVDTNDDGRPDSRAFAGDDRYDTALRLAMHFANSNTPGSVSTVIVASGETQIDAVAAAGIAGYEEAPVLLTRRDQLPKGVATFIEDQGVSRVYVAGGTAVISDDVVEQIEGLDSSPSVDRVAGDNRYGTAAAMAGEIVSAARWCGSDDSAVFLANGNLVPITSAILAGPMSYRMQMPLLLTAMDMLPAETSEYIDDNDVDRVVIIGNTDEVSADVADEIAALGASVDRVAGDDAASTSVEVAKRMWGDCDGLPTDRGTVALVNMNATVDGVTGAPVAGHGIANNDMPMAILLVDESLPASVRDWLASTPEQDADGNKTHLNLVAIGGTKVVSNAVMAAAVDAANTGAVLGTSITVADADRTGRVTDVRMFTVKFTDNLALNGAGDGLTAAAKEQLSDVLYVNGLLASISDEVDAISASLTGGTNTGVAMCKVGGEITVMLTHPLKAGDRIEVRPSSYKFGAGKDQRLLQASSATVGLKAVSNPAPTIEVIAIEGQNNLFVRSNGDAVDDKMHVRTASGAKVNVANITTSDTADAFEPALWLAEDFDFNKDGDKDDAGESADDGDSTAYTLKKGDRAWAVRGAFTLGDAEVPSRYAADDVVSRVKSFRATSVQVGKADPGVTDSPNPATVGQPGHVPAEIEDVSERADVMIGTSVTDNAITITGLWSGDAAGAAGNDWQIAIDSSANYNAAAAHPEIDVSVSNATGVAGGGLIRVQFLAGKPTLGYLAAELLDNSEFADNFSLSYDCTRSRVEINRDNFETTATSLTGGVSSVGIQVNWNDWVALLADGDRLRDQVLGALVDGYDSSALAADTAGADEVTPDQDAYRLMFTAPTMGAHIRFSTAKATELPGLRTGTGNGVVEFGGTFHTANEGTTTTPMHVAWNYLRGENSDDTPVETDDDKDGSATTGAKPESEPVEAASAKQTIRVRSGSVPAGPEVTS